MVWRRRLVALVLVAAVVALSMADGARGAGPEHDAAINGDTSHSAGTTAPESTGAAIGVGAEAVHELERDLPGERDLPPLASDAAGPCNCAAARHQTRKCRYNHELTRGEVSALQRDMEALRAERNRLDASVRGLVADRMTRDKSDREWREMMQVRVEACVPRNETEKHWHDKQLRCLEEKYECVRERGDRDIALRDCLQSREPYTTQYKALNLASDPAAAASSSGANTAVMDVPVSGTRSAADGMASLAAADVAVNPNTKQIDATAAAAADASGSAPSAVFAWPSVTVVTPVCVKRHRWLPNLHRMWAHQDYPGELRLLVFDGRCSKMPEIPAVANAYMVDAAARDSRVRYHFDDSATPPNIGAKRNWMARNVSTEVVVTFDVDDYYGPTYVSRMVWLLTHAGTDADDRPVGMVKLHSWFSLGEGWLMDPPRRYRAWTYIDFEHDPLGWGWTYTYWRKVFDHPKIAFGEVDASEEAGFFHSLRNNGYRIATFADRWFLCLRIVTSSIVRTTGAGPCQANARGCTNLADFMVLTGFGGADKLKPWLDLWDAKE